MPSYTQYARDIPIETPLNTNTKNNELKYVLLSLLFYINFNKWCL